MSGRQRTLDWGSAGCCAPSARAPRIGEGLSDWAGDLVGGSGCKVRDIRVRTGLSFQDRIVYK